MICVIIKFSSWIQLKPSIRLCSVLSAHHGWTKPLSDMCVLALFFTHVTGFKRLSARVSFPSASCMKAESLSPLWSQLAIICMLASQGPETLSLLIMMIFLPTGTWDYSQEKDSQTTIWFLRLWKFALSIVPTKTLKRTYRRERLLEVFEVCHSCLSGVQRAGCEGSRTGGNNFKVCSIHPTLVVQLGINRFKRLESASWDVSNIISIPKSA